MDEQTGLATRSLTHPADVFCERCRYNLRGQDGDIRRCPECGLRNRVVIPYRAVHLFGEKSLLLRSRRRTPEDRPATCVLMAVFASPFVYFNCWGIYTGVWDRPYGASECLLFSGIVSLILIGYWGHEADQFAQACRRRIGWLRVLLLYHLAALIPIGALLGSGCYVSAWADHHQIGVFTYQWVNYVGLVIMPIVSAVIILATRRWLQPWIRRRLDTVIRVDEMDGAIPAESQVMPPPVATAVEIEPLALTQTWPVRIHHEGDSMGGPAASA